MDEGTTPARTRRKKTARERREQKLRAEARVVQTLLAAFEQLAGHRGGTPTRLGAAFASALRLPGSTCSPVPWASSASARPPSRRSSASCASDRPPQQPSPPSEPAAPNSMDSSALPVSFTFADPAPAAQCSAASAAEVPAVPQPEADSELSGAAAPADTVLSEAGPVPSTKVLTASNLKEHDRRSGPKVRARLLNREFGSVRSVDPRHGRYGSSVSSGDSGRGPLQRRVRRSDYHYICIARCLQNCLAVQPSYGEWIEVLSSSGSDMSVQSLRQQNDR
jgi:hypothetical protein